MGNYEFSLVPGVFNYRYDDMTAENEKRKAKGKSPMPPTLKRADLPLLGLHPDFDKSTGSATHENLSSKPWARIRDYVDFLNRTATDGAKHKVVFVIRHGYSVHNYVERGLMYKEVVDGVETDVDNWRHGAKIAYKEKVDLGTLKEAFEKAEPKSSMALTSHFPIEFTDSTATITLLDSKLLPKEVTDALRGKVTNNDVGDLGAELHCWHQKQKFPIPDTIYTSPLSRCMETTVKVYQTVFAQYEEYGRILHPEIKEDLREKRNGDACNYRGNIVKSIEDRRYPFTYDSGFSPNDPYRDDIKKAEKGESMETDEQLEGRMKGVLTNIFDEDEGSVVSLTTHSYSIGALTTVLGFNCRLDEGDIAAFLVKATPVAANPVEAS
ncbi:phosphoglycerate mutase [Apiospora sp. TS-2023a]